ncbi:MAG: NAD(+) synthase [Verrucomicrobia bacterium]|nr:NAD(+) synthase [Verrucomicrobiota bacterium]MBU1735125.1 NAD(+) synthase [Verrucomicrobiota bacterium]MBU1855982.1 NAD(+) synthase [Verrucomicrobiota bacterium]
MKACLAQIHVLPGQPTANTETMLKAIASARAQTAELVVFPEMAIPGYLLGDAWERDAFLRECEACGHRIREASKGLVVVFGNVALDWRRHNEDGRVRKYNALFVAENGRFIGPRGGTYDFVVKTLLPNYREFDDSRYFYDLRRLAAEEGMSLEQALAPVITERLALGCVLCEDAWDTDYGISPLDLLKRHGVDLFINCSCSPFTLNKNTKRNRMFAAHAKRLKKPFLYINSVGIQNNGKTVYTFDGASCIYDAHAHQLSLPSRFDAGLLQADIPLASLEFGTPLDAREDGVADIYQALVFGIREFMQILGVSRVVVGVSGGIDSAVTAALYSRILSRENLLLVNLPSRFNSPTTVNLARELAANLGCYYAEVPIEESVRLTTAQVNGLAITSPAIAGPDGSLRTRLVLNDFMIENVQARDRSSRLLAALAAAFGGVFTCNANKAEATVGYTTLYGDLAGYLAALADLWKGEVYALGRYLNEAVFQREVIPAGCFNLTPSAELGPTQDVDKGLGDPLIYPYHDCLFASWVEAWQRTTPEEILEWYLAGTLERQLNYEGKLADIFPSAREFIADLERWWRQYNGMGVAKRIQSPPVLAIKRRAFGFDHREAQMGVWFSNRYLELKKQALARQG